MVPKGVLDQSVFERMETDDDGTSADLQAIGEYLGKNGLQMIELLIDGNSQCLKDSCGRVDFGMVTAGGSDRLRDGVDKIGRSPYGTSKTAFDNCPGDGAVGALFAIAEEDFCKLRFAKRCQEVRGGASLCRIKPHVERPRRLKAEAPSNVGQLVGRQSQIEQDAIDLRDSEFVENFRQLGITGLFQDAARVGQNFGRPGKHLWVTIQTDKFSRGTEVIEEDRAMTAGSDRPINNVLPRL